MRGDAAARAGTGILLPIGEGNKGAQARMGRPCRADAPPRARAGWKGRKPRHGRARRRGGASDKSAYSAALVGARLAFSRSSASLIGGLLQPTFLAKRSSSCGAM